MADNITIMIGARRCIGGLGILLAIAFGVFLAQNPPTSEPADNWARIGPAVLRIVASQNTCHHF